MKWAQNAHTSQVPLPLLSMSLVYQSQGLKQGFGVYGSSDLSARPKRELGVSSVGTLVLGGISLSMPAQAVEILCKTFNRKGADVPPSIDLPVVNQTPWALKIIGFKT